MVCIVYALVGVDSYIDLKYDGVGLGNGVFNRIKFLLRDNEAPS